MRAAAIVMMTGMMAGVPALARAQAPAPAASTTEKWVPVFEEPRHHLVVDTPTLRILDIQIPPGDTTLFHMHNSAMIYVPIRARARAVRLWVRTGPRRAPRPRRHRHRPLPPALVASAAGPTTSTSPRRIG